MPKTTARKILESALLGKRIRFKKVVEGTVLTGETEPIRAVMGDGSYIKVSWITGNGPYSYILLYVDDEFEILEEEETTNG